jgi:hypothetical protein
VKSAMSGGILPLKGQNSRRLMPVKILTKQTYKISLPPLRNDTMQMKSKIIVLCDLRAVRTPKIQIQDPNDPREIRKRYEAKNRENHKKYIEGK